MKKILTILLILVLTFTSLVSCDKIPGLDSILDKIPGFGGDDTENGPTLDDAKTYLFNTYKDSATAIPNDYDLVGKVIIEGVSFPVTWTASLDSITIKESTKANFWTVDLPDVNAEEVAYVLTATITDADNNKVEVKFNKTLPVIDSTGIVTEPEEGIAYKLFLEQVNLGYTLFAGNTTQNNQQKYIETTLDPKAAVDYFVEKVDGGYKIYTMINNVKNYVYAQGIENSTGISKYIGFSTENASVFTYVQEISTWQVVINNIKYGVGTYNAFETVCISEVTYFKPDNINVSGGQFPVGFMLSSYAETLTPDEKPVASDPTPDTTLTIAEAIALGNTKVKDQYTEGKYYVTGVIKEVYNDQYGNMYITDGTNTLCIYGTYDATGATSYKDMAVKPVAGDTITVYGIIGKYNDPQMKNGWITSHTPGEGGSDTPVDPKPETPTLGVVDAPVAGTAYKLGLFHGGNGNIDVFFNGQNYNNYAWYLAYGDAASAVDVYLEAVEGVEGAYRLYFMNGDAKTYIRMYPRDGDTTKGTMEMTTEVPTECYTYNTEYKTLIYTSVTGEQFYMGSSGTYKSISTSSISYITEATSYVAHFYAPVEGGDTPVDPNPDTPAGPVEVTIPEALAAEVGTEIIVTGTVESFYYEWSDSFGNCSVYIVDDAGNKLLAFRLATKVEIGDNITVTGTIAVYNEVNQIGAGCTAVINSSETPDDGGETPDDGGDTPAGPIEMTVAEALEAAVGTKVKITGTVTEFYQTWNSQYSNVSPYITDDSGAKIIIFRTTVNVQLGDVVTVIGEIGAYNDVNQIAQGNTLTIDVVHVCSEFTDATCVDLAACVVCGKTTGELADHVYVNGKCECGAEEGVATITAGKTMADLIASEGWTSSTTKQSFNLDDVVSVKVDGGNNTGKAYNGDHIRIYATDSPAGTLTISVAEGYELVSVKVTTVTGTYAFLCLDGQSEDICNQTVTVSGSSVVLNSVKNGSDGKQVRVLGIEVTYKVAD